MDMEGMLESLFAQPSANTLIAAVRTLKREKADQMVKDLEELTKVEAESKSVVFV